VSFSLRELRLEVVLLDIEGTTTPIAFVHDVLFPYSRARVADYLAAHANDPAVAAIITELRHETETSAGPDDGSDLTRVVAHVHTLIDQDRKSRPLKTLQGLIWEDGYATGALTGEVYVDVPPALERWTSNGIRVGIFSSGSVLAQQLIFRHSNAGDLTRYLTWHFDTAVGAKSDQHSYIQISQRIERPPARILFVSDVVTELESARGAGMMTALSVRSPAAPPSSSTHPVVTTFDQIKS
jgi:enolase-phosphatase E1